MTVIAMTLPLARTSAIVLPRRDLVAGTGDTVTMQLSVVASDAVGAPAVDLTGAALKLLVWQPTASLAYGWPYIPSAALWTANATILAGAGGRADVTIAAATRTTWPARAAWALQLTQGGDANTLASGVMNAGSNVGLLPDAYPQATG